MKGLARLLVGFLLAVTALSACGATSDVAQIKAVIEKTNHEQEDAFAAHDPTLMQDTNTAQNYVYMAQTNDLLEGQGVVGVRLTDLKWGAVKVLSTTTASAETWETWEQTDSGGNSFSQTDRNIYSLVRVGKEWKIDSIDWPDNQRDPQTGRPASSSGSPAPIKGG